MNKAFEKYIIEVNPQGNILDPSYNRSQPEYVEWLEKTVESLMKPSLLKWVKKMFKHAEKKQWFETYWFFDLHGVISKPDYRKDVKEIIYYPYVKETLQFITNNRPDIIMILFTSSSPEELKVYTDILEKDNIHFKYINENPEVTDAKGAFGCYDKKPYYNVVFEDKAGFTPETDWQPFYEYFLNSEYKPDPNWSFKTIESYHKK